MTIDGSLNENFVFIKFKTKFVKFKLPFLVPSTDPRKYYMMPYISQKASKLVCMICLDILCVNRDMTVLVQPAQTAWVVPLSSLKDRQL